MKTRIKIASLSALSLMSSHALAFETEIERAGMVYLNIPLGPDRMMQKRYLYTTEGQDLSAEEVESLKREIESLKSTYD